MVKLSPSRIKKLLSCSFQYYASYILKVPDLSNDGASRGNSVHPILECLLNKKREHYVKAILKSGTIGVCPSVERLAKIHAKKLNVHDEVNFKMINDFILTALNFDFYCEGAEEIFSEYEINIKTEKYWFGGFIDKLAVYSDKVKITDYKTSKAKFTSDDLKWNLQSLLYSLAVYKQFPHLEPEVEFLFLKFKTKPHQNIKHSAEELNKIEAYLEEITEHLKDFGIEKAYSNFAKDSPENRWMCGKCLGDKKVDGSPAWICSYKYPFLFWQLLDENGQILKSSRKKSDFLVDINKNPSYSVVSKKYEGCPKWGFAWQK